MARMTLNQLLKRNIVGGQVFAPLSKQAGVEDWEYSGGGVDAAGNPLQLGIPDANKLAALQGYTFDFNNTGPANTGTLTAYDPTGKQAGSYFQQDQSTGNALGEFAALAAAGFGGLGALGLGPLGGMLGGLGGAAGAANPAIGNGAFLGEVAGFGAGGAGGGLGGAAGAAGGGGVLSTLANSPWAKLIPAAGQLLGTYMQAQSTKDAVRANAAQQQKALDLQQQMYQEGVARQQPFLQGGTEDYNRLRSLMSGGPGAAQQFLQMDPGYGFRLSEGLKSLDRQAAARGGLISGGALKAAQRYGQDVASQEFGNAYGRLAGLAQVGPAAAGVTNQLGQNYASGASGVYGQLGETGANAALTRGSAYAGGLNQLGYLAGRYYGQQPGN